MANAASVSVITAATGHRNLAKCLESVQAQSYGQIEHIVVIDGIEREVSVRKTVASIDQRRRPVHVVAIPHPTGKDGWCGHRIYGGLSFLSNADFVSFLDEDNWFEPDHIESLVSAISREKAVWAFSLRRIVDQEGNFVCLDNCECLGNLHPVYNNKSVHMVDTSCYLVRRDIAIQLSPIWNRPTRPGPGLEEPDHQFCRTLLEQHPQVATNCKHTVNYTVGNRSDSVKADFFIYGNRMMDLKYPEGLPWAGPSK